MLSTRTLVSVMAICMSCVALLFALSNSGSTQEAKKANPRIQDLQQKRLAVLRKVCDETEAMFMSSRTSYGEVLAAKAALSAARIEYADTRQDRIKACEDAVKNALDMQDLAHERAKAPQSLGHSQTDELNAEAFVLESQIRLEKAMVE